MIGDDLKAEQSSWLVRTRLSGIEIYNLLEDTFAYFHFNEV